MSQLNPVRLLGATLLAVACASPAFAQADFSGHWAPLFHEDHPERLPGPELGDYLGIPLSEAGRLRADSYDGDRISVVQEYQCRPHAGDYMMRGLSNMRVDAIRDPVTNRLTAYHLRMGFQEMERTIYLDGRPRPSPNARVHLVGLLRRHVAGQRAEHLHDAPQGKLHPPERHPGERQAHVHRALGPPRQLPDGADRHHRSRDPHRAARAQPDVGAGSDAADGTRHLRDRARGAVRGRQPCRTISPAPIRFCTRWRTGTASPPPPRAAAPRRCTRSTGRRWASRRRRRPRSACGTATAA